MKDWQEIASERLAFIKEAQALLKRKVSVWQGLLYSRIADVLRDLETDADGRVLYNASNQARSAQVAELFRRFGRAVMDGELQPDGKKRGGLLDWLLAKLNTLFTANETYLKRIGGDLTDPATAREQVFRALGYDGSTGLVVKDSWLDNVAQHSEVKTKVMQRISGAMSSGTDLTTFRRQFRDEFLDTKSGLGLLSKHYNTHTGNLFASVDRQAAQNMGEAAGLEYFIYSGTTIETSRDFCENNNNKLFHKSIFDVWNKRDWPGKIKNSDVRVTLGGHQCRHTVNMISAQMAKRMIAGGRAHGLTPEQLAKLMGNS